MSIRLTTISGTVLAVLVACTSTADAQFAGRGSFRIAVADSHSKRFVAKSYTTKSATKPAAKSSRLVGSPYRSGGKAKPPGDKTSDNQPPKRPPGHRPPGRSDDPGGKKPPKRPPVIVVVPPVITDPPLLPLPLLPPAADRAGAPPLPPSLLPPQPPGPSAPPAVSQQPEFVPDEVLVTVSTGALPELEAAVAQVFAVTIIERTPLPLIDARLVRMRIPDGRAVPALVAALGADPRVALAQPNFLYRHNNDPDARAMPAAATAGIAGLQYALAKLGAADAHLLAQGRGARVAVIDSGVDQTHPDFSGARIKHFDATAEAGASDVDLDTHGTSIAGIIAARGTVQGMAPAAEIMSARVFRKSAATGRAAATTVNILKGVTWSVESGARVLNMSFAGPRDPLLERHVKVIAARGLVSIAAAGNDGPNAAPAFPAAYEDVIAVTAIDANDRLYDKANRGAYVALAAPGVDIIVPTTGRSHEFQSGTSFAAAHVSGIAALLLEVNSDLTPDRLREILLGATDDLGTPGRDPEFGAGSINATKAVVLAAKTAAKR